VSDTAFDSVTTFIETELEFATSHYNDSYLKRRLKSRMRRTGTDSYDAYHDLLADSDDEQEALLDALSINVTGFFRNPDVWDGIANVLDDLASEGRSLRAWSAACADGREPYSLSMLAADSRSVDEQSVSITATDINEKALDVARAGAYENTRTIDIDDQLSFLRNYSQYVDRDGDQFQIRETIQQRVSFEHHDLINDQPKSDFDLVMCRNLFIYIDNEFKEPILQTIADSLRSGGYLVIGKAETIPPRLQSAFSVIDGRLRIYQRE
jgi:chemotaxis protein methyltransferase CheR